MNAVAPKKRVFTPEQRMRLGRAYMIILNWNRSEENQEVLPTGHSLDASISNRGGLKPDLSQEKGDPCSV